MGYFVNLIVLLNKLIEHATFDNSIVFGDNDPQHNFLVKVFFSFRNSQENNGNVFLILFVKRNFFSFIYFSFEFRKLNSFKTEPQVKGTGIQKDSCMRNDSIY